MAIKAKLQGTMKGWESIGKRERVIITLFGLEIRYRRRGYRRKNGEETIYRYPLDEQLGIKPGERYCPLVQQLALGLAAKMSYQDAATIMERYLYVPISHQEIYRWLQEAGKVREAEQKIFWRFMRPVPRKWSSLSTP